MAIEPRLVVHPLNVQKDKQWSVKFSPTPYRRLKYHQNHSDATLIAIELLFLGKDEGQLLHDRMASRMFPVFSNVALAVENLLKNEQNHFLKESPSIDRRLIDGVLDALPPNNGPSKFLDSH